MLELKNLKKTALPIISLYKDWEHWYLRKEGLESASKVAAVIVLIIIVIIIVFLVYRYIRRINLEKKGPNQDLENDDDKDNRNVY